MMSGSELSGLLVRSWGTLLGALCAGMAAAAFFGIQVLDGGRSVAAALEDEPLVQASSFAFAWGSEADASTLLGQRAARLRTDRVEADSTAAYELALTEFRRAIVERRSESEMLELCRATPKCIPDKLAGLISKISAKRRVGVAR